MGDRPGMQPHDLGLLAVPTDPRWSPDGSTVALTVVTADVGANAYRSRIWLAAADGSSAPRPFSAGGRSRDTRPRWSPDGTRLAFVTHRHGPWPSGSGGEAGGGGPEGGERAARAPGPAGSPGPSGVEPDGEARRRRPPRGGPGGSQILILPVTGGGEAIVAAAWSEDIDELAWSPDAMSLVFLARSRPVGVERDRPPRRITRFSHRLDDEGWTMERRRRVYVVPADGSAPPVGVGGPEPADGDAGDVAGVSWSPDSARLAWCQPIADDWDVALTQALVVAPVSRGDGPTVVCGAGRELSRPAWSSDGRSIAVVVGEGAEFPRNGQIAVVAVAGAGLSEPRTLTGELDRNCAPALAGAREPVWDGDGVVFQVEDGGRDHLYRVETAGGAPRLVVGGEAVVTGFDVRAGAVAYTATSPGGPAELWVLDPGAAAARRLSSFGSRLTTNVTVGTPEHFRVRAGDGEEIDAWYLAPTGPDRGATLLNIHGGPFSQYTCGFFDEFAVQAGHGYAVVWCNPRGSSGRSEAWGRAIRGSRCAVDPGTGWGGVDADDVMAVLDAALVRYARDPARVGVLGGSYGGYLTSWLIGHSDRFAAACSERSVNNQLTMVWTSDIGTSFQLGYVGVSHLEDPDEFRRLSPVTYVGQMSTPLLILHSDGDLRCPVSQAEELWVALRLLGRPVEFVRFPGASHELSRSGPPLQRVRRFELQLEFFDRYLDPPAR